MLTPPLSAKFHATNRATLAKAIGDDAIAIIDTADVLTRPGDYEYPFRPDSNFYYLTGIDEPEAVLVLIPGHSNPNMRELLSVSGTSEFVGTWEGERHTDDEAAKVSGVKTVLKTNELDGILDRLLQRYRTVYLNAEESLELTRTSPAQRRAHHMRNRLPLHDLRSALPFLTKQRMVKHPEEVAQVRRAIEITGAGLTAAYRVLGSAQHEYELEAELTAEFIRRGSEHAFQPIIAAGPAATVIHHMKNHNPVASTDLVLFDVGAESHYYCADISRTVAARGQWTDRQQAVYQAVQRVQQAAIALIKPGLKRPAFEHQVGQLVLQELEQLGLEKPDLRTHFPHATSHHLGLDVHDAGDYAEPFRPGMIMTVEPGIYLKSEGIGVRLEDDILVTEDGCENLSQNLLAGPEAA